MPLSPDMITDIRADLERQLARLERSMEMTSEAVRPVELDQQAVGRLSRADSLQNQQLSKNLQEREEARYGAIRAALDRIDDGRYGICTECGDEIQPGRLFVVPEAARCPACTG